METKASQAVEGAKDAKFLRERQLKAAAWVKNWMSTKCVLIEASDSMAGGMNEFTAFSAQFHGSAGKQ